MLAAVNYPHMEKKPDAHSLLIAAAKGPYQPIRLLQWEKLVTKPFQSTKTGLKHVGYSRAMVTKIT